jgi:3-hydroxyacyl-[acyl-carrier-protein] dehydratase
MRFLLVDRIVKLEPGREVIVRKNVSSSEDFFTDHFAGRPVMPGCLILETCDQAARLLLATAADFTRLPSLAGVAQAKFQHFVVPGDTLEVHAVVASAGEGTTEVRVTARVEGRRVAQTSLTYTVSDAASDPAAARACGRMREWFTILTTEPGDAARARGPGAAGKGEERG